MIVYKNFLRMVWSRKTGVIVYLCIFLLISFLSIQSKAQGTKEFAETPLTIFIADKDHSALSQQLIVYLQSKHTVISVDGSGLNEETLLKKMRKDISVGAIDAGLIIRDGFERKAGTEEKGLMSIKDDRRRSAFYLDLEIRKFLLFALSTKEAEGAFDFEKVRKALGIRTGVVMIPAARSSSALRGLTVFFNFLGWGIFSLIINSIGWAMFALNDERIRIRNAASPVSDIRFSVENFTAQLTVIAVYLFILISFAVLTAGRNMQTAPLASYTLHAVVYAAVILSMTFMLNAALKKGSVMGIVGTVLPLALAFISGIFLDQALLPKSVTAIARLFPTYYYVGANSFTERMLRPDWRNTGVMLLFLFAYFTLGVYFNKLNRVRNRIEFAQQ